MKQIIEKLKEQIANSIEYGNDLDAASWGMQEGVLISANEAQQIVEALEGMEERRAFTLPKDEEVNGMLNIALRYLSDEQANALIEGLVKRFVRPDDIKTKMLKDLSAKELEDDVNRNKI